MFKGGEKSLFFRMVIVSYIIQDRTERKNISEMATTRSLVGDILPTRNIRSVVFYFFSFLVKPWRFPYDYYVKNNESLTTVLCEFRRLLNIERNQSGPIRNTV